MRTGIGYDIHRLIPTIEKNTLPIGGVEIPAYSRVHAHSDGDVLFHALVDACLGALALGDIGQWFSDKDPKHKNRKSEEFLRPVLAQIKSIGYEIHNIDSILFLENPKIAPFCDSIRRNIASILGMELHAVSIKAKTMEGLGPIGENKAIAAQVVVTLKELSKHGSPRHQ